MPAVILVPKQTTKGIDPITALNEPVPIVVANLVAKVA
jgi:hypothetical protein